MIPRWVAVQKDCWRGGEFPARRIPRASVSSVLTVSRQPFRGKKVAPARQDLRRSGRSRACCVTSYDAATAIYLAFRHGVIATYRAGVAPPR